MNTNTLTLINLQPEDAGNYRCVATNASGSSESNYATVDINGTLLSTTSNTHKILWPRNRLVFQCYIHVT